MLVSEPAFSSWSREDPENWGLFKINEINCQCIIRDNYSPVLKGKGSGGSLTPGPAVTPLFSLL